jgi:hypothetical protein
MDGYHHPRAYRHRQGRHSAVGYYEDAYDFARLAELVLAPLGPDGSGRFVPTVLDLAADQPARADPVLAAADAVLIVDGTFLQRGELTGLWDEVVFIDSDLAQARIRGVTRDADLLGGIDAAELVYAERYHAACQLYLEAIDPAARASIVIANHSVDRPVLLRIGGAPSDTAKVFSYGTLQQPDVQMVTFGRHLAGTPDRLPGHRRDWIEITDPAVISASGSNRHPIVSACADQSEAVAGTLFTLTASELAASDEYEVEDYRRVPVTLASGASAWTYLAGPS